MLYSLSQVKIDANKKVDKNLLENIIEKKLHLSKNKISHLQIVKKSIDARNKIEVFYVYTVEFEVFDKKSNANLKRNRNKNLKIITKSTEYTLPKTNNGKQLFRSIVVGFGPAGIFSAYLLALSGLKPIIIERGSDVDTRIKDV
ncbi:MAG: FAD-dependent oxidoreductase, partial [Lachnospiraceae bacterium]|nr:FAD-dependent oxidoreductase [Lachnospiraceae bacterium]